LEIIRGGAGRSEQARIGTFYRDGLGCTVRMQNDEVDRFQLGDVHVWFVYQNTALDENDFLKAIYLELRTDNVEEMKQKILAFGVKKLDLPDPHQIFAMMSSQCPFVVKLSRKRVDEFVASGVGKRFEPRPGRIMKEWLALKDESEELD
jgi:hypothetical protein